MIRLLVRNLGLCLCYRTVGRGGGSVGESGFVAGSEFVAAGAAKRAVIAYAISAAMGGKRAFIVAVTLLVVSPWLYCSRRRVQKALILSDCRFSL